MSASEALLQSLHNALAEDLLARLKEGTASAADRAVIAKFLKDNSITCEPSESNALGALEAKAKERASKRRKLSEDEKTEVSEVARIMGVMQ